MTFTTKEETESATATLESANLANEQAEFLRIENARRVYATLFDKTNSSSPGHAARLNGSTNEKYGLAKSLSVMPGDTIKMEVFAKYVDANQSNWTQALNDLITAVNANTAGVVVDGSGYSVSTPSFNYGGLLNTSGSSGNGPKAYLNWLVFDRDYNFLNGGYQRMSDVAKENGQDVAHEKLSASILATEPGYVYIYLSNEETTPVEVFFDDFKVVQVKSPVIQMDDYYPFGLITESFQRENSTHQDFLYNGKELQNEMDLGWYDYHARHYDPTIARWMVIDPLAEKMRRWSPYNYLFNNPLRFIDPDGMVPDDVITQLSNVRTSGNGLVTRDATITMTVKVVNSAGADLSKTMFADGKGTIDLTKTFGGTGAQPSDGPMPSVQTDIVSFKVNYEVVSSLDEVGKDDHVMMIVNDIPAFKDKDGATTDPRGMGGDPGRIAAVEAGTIKDGSFDHVAKHEWGHNLGLAHSKSGLMQQGGTSDTLSAIEKGAVAAGQVINANSGDGTYKASSAYGRSDSKTLAEKFLKRYNIK